MRLDELIVAYPSAVKVRGEDDAIIESVEIDSRLVGPGSLFCCISGTNDDGHRFIAQALDAGAVGILTERDHGFELGEAFEIRVPDGSARNASAIFSAAIAGNPAERLRMVGITGTNGKTTVAHLLGEILRGAGFDARVIGTLTGARTTPPAPELHRMLQEAVAHAEREQKPGAVAMEVSSHALDQGRVSGIDFDVCVFTNLSHDHLDYHGTMEQYFETKAQLFDPAHCSTAVIWVDSSYGRQLASRSLAKVVEVSSDSVTQINSSLTGSTFLWRGKETSLGLVGRVNVINAALALEAAVALGVDSDVAREGLRGVGPIQGRMELVSDPGAAPSVIVDYAHTPDALEGLLSEARRLVSAAGKVILVFGCGGERDQQKRPLMGDVASNGADVVIVTTDNPRGEDPADISSAIIAGASSGAGVREEPDRRRAIKQAIEMAGPDDVVLVAGKGHESTQIIGLVEAPFDDRVVAREILAERNTAC